MKKYQPRRGQIMFKVMADLLLNAVGLFSVLTFDLVRREAGARHDEAASAAAAAKATEEANAAKEGERIAKEDEELAKENERSRKDGERAAKKGEAKAKAGEQAAREGEAAAAAAATAAGAELDKVNRGVPIDLVFAIDVSASQAAWIDDLTAAIAEIAKLLPRVTTLRVGVVLYRDGKTHHFAMQEVQSADDDGGASLAALTKNLGKVKVARAPANIDQGVAEALVMLDSHAADGTRQVFALLADVGPGEMAHHAPADRQRLCEQVNAWASAAGRDRRVVALYSGVDASPEREFFVELARVRHGVFCDEASESFVAVFDAIFSPASAPRP